MRNPTQLLMGVLLVVASVVGAVKWRVLREWARSCIQTSWMNMFSVSDARATFGALAVIAGCALVGGLSVYLCLSGRV